MPSVSGSTLRNAPICLILAAFPSVHPLSSCILGVTIWWLVLGFVQLPGGGWRGIQHWASIAFILYIHIRIY